MARFLEDVLDAFPLFFVLCLPLQFVAGAQRISGPSQSVFRGGSVRRLDTQQHLHGHGLAGSAYGHCAESGTVHGNVLLDFPTIRSCWWVACVWPLPLH
jgi:hypothetical protein